MNTSNNQTFINITREVSVLSLLISYLDLNFEVIKKADKSRYTNGDHISLVVLDPIALFSNLKFTLSNWKHLEDISQAHILSLLYKLECGAKNSDDLSFGFDRDRNRRRNGLTNNKNKKGKYHVTIMLRDIFGFSEYQEKAT